MRNTKIEIGEKVKKRREVLGLLQPQLASLAGVSTRTIQLVELGTGNPSMDTLSQIADALGLTVRLVLKDLSQKEG